MSDVKSDKSFLFIFFAADVRSRSSHRSEPRSSAADLRASSTLGNSEQQALPRPEVTHGAGLHPDQPPPQMRDQDTGHRPSSRHERSFTKIDARVRTSGCVGADGCERPGDEPAAAQRDLSEHLCSPNPGAGHHTQSVSGC